MLILSKCKSRPAVLLTLEHVAFTYGNELNDGFHITYLHCQSFSFTISLVGILIDSWELNRLQHT